jgi:hypothetical protein
MAGRVYHLIPEWPGRLLISLSPSQLVPSASLRAPLSRYPRHTARRCEVESSSERTEFRRSLWLTVKGLQLFL